MLEILYYILLLVIYTSFVALTLFKRDMKVKAKYKECMDDAITNVGTNNPYVGNIDNL